MILVIEEIVPKCDKRQREGMERQSESISGIVARPIRDLLIVLTPLAPEGGQWSVTSGA